MKAKSTKSLKPAQRGRTEEEIKILKLEMTKSNPTEA